jgi:hypothetical protein
LGGAEEGTIKLSHRHFELRHSLVNCPRFSFLAAFHNFFFSGEMPDSLLQFSPSRLSRFGFFLAWALQALMAF